MRIGQLATATGIPAKTIRYYEQVGLLPDPPRRENGYRDYDETAARRLAFIRSAQALGLALGEIRGVLSFRDRGEVPCEHVAMIIEHHARDVEEQIAALQRLRTELGRLARRARKLSPRDCEEVSFCHIIEG